MGDTSSDLAGGSTALSLASLGLAPVTGGASLLSLGATGLGAVGSIMSAQGTSSADTYKAEQLEQAAEYGNLKATQTNGQMTRNLNLTLGNIDAVRAAARTDPTSPTGAAVRDTVEQQGTERKNIAVNSISAQAQEDEANAAYLREAGSQALLSGDINAGAGILKGVAGLPGLRGGGTPGSPPGLPLNILPG